jgi:hypothetical protein
MHQRQPSYHPFLKEQLTQRAAWEKPKDCIEPFTASMFDALFAEIQSSSDPSGTFISPLHAIFNWTLLGLFTGSRLGKYGQSRRSKGSRFNTFLSLLTQENGLALPLLSSRRISLSSQLI